MKINRTCMLAVTISALLQTTICQAQDGGITKTRSSPFVTTASVNLADVTLKGGFWKERTDVNREASLPYLYALAVDPAKGHVKQNFEIAAGLRDGKFAGTTGRMHGPTSGSRRPHTPWWITRMRHLWPGSTRWWT